MLIVNDSTEIELVKNKTDSLIKTIDRNSILDSTGIDSSLVWELVFHFCNGYKNISGEKTKYMRDYSIPKTSIYIRESVILETLNPWQIFSFDKLHFIMPWPYKKDHFANKRYFLYLFPNTILIKYIDSNPDDGVNSYYHEEYYFFIL